MNTFRVVNYLGNIPQYQNFDEAIKRAADHLRRLGVVVDTEKWQGIPTGGRKFREILNYSFGCWISEDLDILRNEIRPNLPWADDHFEERVSGKPLNPGEQYKNWPYYKNNPQNDRFRTEGEKFTHTYMERYWPKQAGDRNWREFNYGIRYPYGDLDDVVRLLEKEPFTRQAYFPVWFPEDTGVVHGGRVPCTLGYQFFRRGDLFHIIYYIRSCDFIRHFRDDIYLACRLLLWVLQKLRDQDPGWDNVTPGLLVMHIGSLHVFEGEEGLLK